MWNLVVVLSKRENLIAWQSNIDLVILWTKLTDKIAKTTIIVFKYIEIFLNTFKYILVVLWTKLTDEKRYYIWYYEFWYIQRLRWYYFTPIKSCIELSKILMLAWMEDNQSVCTVDVWVFVKKGTYNGK
jgi:hypothetical protein